MRYAQFRKYDVANGPGIRAVLFVSGCTHRCEDCFNQSYQDFKTGTVFEKTFEDTFIEHVKHPRVQGVTILGGEPFDQIMDDQLEQLLKRIKQETAQSIWIYSGYTYEELIKHPRRLAILEQCDVLVDGPFIKELKNLKLKFRGSSNQRIINLPLTLKTGDITLQDI